MMESTYKGDSPGKKMQRLRTWLHMYALGQVSGAPYKGALVLAGDGGDLDVLSGLQFPVHSITAVDLDRACLRKCEEHHPRVSLVYGDVGEWCRHRPYTLAHIDFCGVMSVQNIRTIARVAQNFSSYPGVLAVTMMKGRERLDSRGLLSHLKPSDRSYFRQMFADAPVRDSYFSDMAKYALADRLDPMRMIRRSERLLREHGDWIGYADRARARQMALTEAVHLTTLVNKRGRLIYSAGVMDYHSRSIDSQGTPFMTAFYLVGTPGDGDWLDMIGKEHPRMLQVRDSMPLVECQTALQATVVHVAKEMGEHLAMKAFGVSRGTLVAWKAHHSRGTYDGVLPAIGSGSYTDGSEREGLVFRQVRIDHPLGTTWYYR